MSVIDELTKYTENQVTSWRRVNAVPTKWGVFIIALLFSMFAVYLQVQYGAVIFLILIFLIAAVLLAGYIMKNPRMGLYLAVAFLMFDSRSIAGPVNLSLSNSLLILTLIAVMMRWAYHRHGHPGARSVHLDKVSLLLGGGIIFAALLSLFVAEYPETVLRLIVTVAGGLIVLFVTQALVTHTVEVERLLNVYTLGAVICAVLGVLQTLLARFAGIQYGRILWALGGGTETIFLLDIPRVTSTWLDPNIFGVFLVPAVIFALLIPVRNWVKGLLAGILLAGIAVSYSRTAWISTAVAVAITIGVYRLTRKAKKSVGTTTIALRAWVLLLVGLVLLVALPWEGLWNQLLSINPLAYEQRIQMSRVGFGVYLDSPIFGIGPGNLLKTAGLFTHNSYLGVLIEYGIIGGLAWFSLIVLTLWRGLKMVFQYTRTDLWRLRVGSLGAFAGLLVGGLGVEIQNAKFAWLMIAVATILTMQGSSDVRTQSTNPGGKRK